MDSTDDENERFFDADEDQTPKTWANQLASPARNFASHGQVPKPRPAKSHRYSEREHPPPIPTHFLETGHPAAIHVHPQQQQHPQPTELQGEPKRKHDSVAADDALISPANANPLPTSEGAQPTPDLLLRSAGPPLSLNAARDALATTLRGRLAGRSRQLPARRSSIESAKTTQVDSRIATLLENRPRSSAGISMARMRGERDEDLFLELADTQAAHGYGRNDVQSRAERAASRAMKRRSLPADAMSSPLDRIPYSNGNSAARPLSRIHSSTISSDIQRHMDRFSNPHARLSGQVDDSVSASGASSYGRNPRRFSAAPERSPLSPSRLRSSELQNSNQARIAATARPEPEVYPGKDSDSQDESPAESSEPKQAESNSADSQTVDTVWDELDDLKSRIKKLELTKKMPSTSSAAVSGESSERPRTATTAPTTIDSSPKQERHSTPQTHRSTPTVVQQPTSETSIASLHPLLDSALKKAKPLLNGALYRTLEATATDAMQLVAMTAGGSSQGSAFPLSTDRQVKRKADAMCRNLTDLCLALCEGKHESTSFAASPIVFDPPRRSSPSARYSRQGLESEPIAIARPMSRLEARRSSILGVAGSSPLGTSFREDYDDHSDSEQESAAPSVPFGREPRRLSRAPSTLLRNRLHYQDDASIDDDPTVRPPSRAMTDLLGLRARAVGNHISSLQHITPTSRDFTSTRRGSEVVSDDNRDSPRLSSITSETRRRRFLEHSTPPSVMEEDHDLPGDHPQGRRRITSLGQFSNRRSATDSMPGRTSSLAQRRHVIVE